jgi:hypothetical protein
MILKTIDMKLKRFLFVCILTAISGIGYAQHITKEELLKYRDEMREQLAKYSTSVKEDIKNYRDSINLEFAKYLGEKWTEFDLQRRELNFEPMPEPPVYEPPVPVTPQPQPKPEPQPQPKPEPQPQPKPEPQPQPKPEPQPQPKPEPDQQPTPVIVKYPVKAEFFGKQIEIQDFKIPSKSLSGVSEKAVANYWLALSKQPSAQLVEDVERIRKELQLNDWGTFMLVGEMFKAHFTHGNENEQVIFSIFVLNQLGYKARIGRADEQLVPLVAFKTKLSHTDYFRFGAKNNEIVYYVLNVGRKKFKSLETCGREYGNNSKIMTVDMNRLPDLSDKIATKVLTFRNKEYVFDYNKNFVDFVGTYPNVDFAVYGSAPLEKLFMNSLQTNLLPVIQNKSQTEAVNFLLHFTQNAFSYKTDQNYYGYEKWNFAEETLVSQYSDCDDRAIFFAQTVRNLLGMKVVLVYYPGRHLAAAVHFDDPQIIGTSFMYENVKYFICDPTYTNANAGAEMPKLVNATREIILLN